MYSGRENSSAKPWDKRRREKVPGTDSFSFFSQLNRQTMVRLMVRGLQPLVIVFCCCVGAGAQTSRSGLALTRIDRTRHAAARDKTRSAFRG